MKYQIIKTTGDFRGLLIKSLLQRVEWEAILKLSKSSVKSAYESFCR